MKNHLYLVILLSLLFHSNVSIADEKDKSIIWEITSSDLQAPSYLFGTIHMICKEKYLWTDKMDSVFKKSNELCMEMDLDDPTILMKIASGMILKDGKVLKDYFSANDYSLLEQYFRDSLGMSIQTFSLMKPVAIQTLIMTGPSFCDSMVSYELILTDNAKKANKEITGLESPEEQIKLFDRLSSDSIANNIIKYIKGESSETDNYDALITAYSNQDIEALYSYIQNDSMAIDDMDQFLDERNKHWIYKMIDKMEQRSIFFAVGAGHLWGENGLIQLLRNEGYKVTPLH